MILNQIWYQKSQYKWKAEWNTANEVRELQLCWIYNMVDNSNNISSNYNNDNKNKKNNKFYAFCPQSFHWTACLEQSATRQSHFVPRTSQNFKAVTSLATCPPKTCAELSSLPSQNKFLFLCYDLIQLPKWYDSTMRPAQTTVFCLLHYYKPPIHLSSLCICVLRHRKKTHFGSTKTAAKN